MSPEELQNQIDELRREVEILKRTQRTENIDEIDDQLILDQIGVTESNITITVNVDGGMGGSVDVLDYPDNWFVRRWKGKVGLIPMYTLDKK